MTRIKNTPSRRDDKRPLTETLAESLRDLIQKDRIAPGGFLPSENALCDSHGISRVTVRRALKQLAEDGWIESRPGRGWQARSPQARAEAAANSKAIGLVFHNTPDAREILQAAQRRIEEAGWNTEIFYGEIGRAEFASTLPLDSMRGLLCYSGMGTPPGFLASAEKARIPIVCIGHEIHESYDCVCIDHAHDTSVLARQLYEEKYRTIGYFSADVLCRNDPGFVKREHGYRAAMRQLNLRPSILYLPDNVLLPKDHPTVREWIQQLRTDASNRCAVMCSSSTLANGLLLLLAKDRVRVPEEVCITGFEPGRSDKSLLDSGLDSYLALKEPREQLGLIAANRLLSRLSGDTSRPHLSLLRSECVIYRRVMDWAPQALTARQSVSVQGL